MKKKSTILALLISMFTYSAAIACSYPAGGPTLQLDIANSHYDDSTDTIVANSNAFTLYAYLLMNDKNKLTDTYYISAALTPKTELNNGGNFGSFSYNYSTTLPSVSSQSYSGTKDVTGDMIFGTPPIETLETMQPRDPGDLPKHDVFSTYFTEFKFQFNDADERGAYNTQDRAKAGTDINSNGSGMHYKAFTFDLTGMDSGYGIHFDLYNETTKDKIENWGKRGCNPATLPDIDVSEFAPFSHDAEGWKINPPPAVPEPSTFALLGAGLLGAGLYRVRRRK